MNNEIIQKIESQYVGRDCIQIMMPYLESLTVISDDGIQYHFVPDSDNYINKYLEDKRKKQFPYSNIPIHYTKNNESREITEVNQLIDFERPYLLVGDGFYRELYAIKKGSEALLVNNPITSDKKIKHMTYTELMDYISKRDEEELYYINMDGYLFDQDSIPTEEELFDYIKNVLSMIITDFEAEKNNPNSKPLGDFLRKYHIFLDYAKECMKEIDFSLIDFNTRLIAPFLVVRLKEGNIEVEEIEPIFTKLNDYKITTRQLHINRYSLEQLRYIVKLYPAKEPNIPLRLNPGVTRSDIRKAKQKVKALRNRIN